MTWQYGVAPLMPANRHVWVSVRHDTRKVHVDSQREEIRNFTGRHPAHFATPSLIAPCQFPTSPWDFVISRGKGQATRPVRHVHTMRSVPATLMTRAAKGEGVTS